VDVSDDRAEVDLSLITSPARRWAPWWGLLVVPTLFLTNQSAAYAIVAFACRSERQSLVHLFPALTLAIALLGVALSGWCVLRSRGAGAAVRPERRFLEIVSLATAALFVLATLAQWYVAAALSPCVQ
jgi:hypothetical protein